jgi:Vacuolar sorting protein 9 (VPS9) domain
MGAILTHKQDSKEIYLQLIKAKKKSYFDKRKDFININTNGNWKSVIIKETNALQNKFPDADWAKDLLSLCVAWNNLKDYNWRFNLIWFDYLKISSSDASVCCSCDCFKADDIYGLLHNHFMDTESNFIGKMIAVFVKSFYNQHIEELGGLVGAQNSILHETAEKIFAQLDCFVLLAVQALINYYGGIIIQKIQESSSDVYDFVIEEIIREPIHELVLKLYLMKDQKKEEKYLQKINKFRNLTCTDLYIDKDFCLDIDFIGIPYEKPIKQLRSIISEYSPFKKIKVIMLTSQLICESINDYWAEKTAKVKNSIINPDQIISIFTYIILKSQIKNLRGHVNIIKKFAKFKANKDSIGYYISTIEACIEHIQNIKSEPLKK